MIADVKIEKVTNQSLDRDEIIVCGIDMVLLLTDFEVFKSLVRGKNSKSLIKNWERFEDVSHDAIQPIIFDRKKKNMADWLLSEDVKKDITDIDKFYEDFKNDISEKVYKNAEPSEFAKSLPILFGDKRLAQFYVVCSSNAKRKTAQLNALVELLGPYAYRLRVIELSDGESLIDAIIEHKIKCTSIYYDDINIMKEAEDKGLDMMNLCFMISDLSYNYEISESHHDMALLKLDPNYFQDTYGTGLGIQELKRFNDEKYFAMG